MSDKQEVYDCHQCGNESTQFQEGVCVDCCKYNQDRLDEHNAQFDYWESLTDKQRENQISLKNI